MKKNFVIDDQNIKNFLIYSLIGICVIFLAFIQYPTLQSKKDNFAEFYCKSFSVQIGSVLLPMLFCVLRAKAVQRLLVSNMIIRFTSRISFAIYMLKRNLIYSVMVVIALNFPIVLFFCCGNFFEVDLAISFVLCIVLQILYFFLLCMVQQLACSVSRSWGIAYFITVLFSSVDFIMLNTMENPIYIGWGLVLSPWEGDLQRSLIRIFFLNFSMLILFFSLYWKVDFLSYDRGTSQ